jgi:hypothetical protein
MRAVALLALAACAPEPAGAELLVAVTAAGRAPATTRLATKQARKTHARARAACPPQHARGWRRAGQRRRRPWRKGTSGGGGAGTFG